MKGSVYFSSRFSNLKFPAAAELKLEQDELLELLPTWPEADSGSSGGKVPRGDSLKCLCRRDEMV